MHMIYHILPTTADPSSRPPAAIFTTLSKGMILGAMLTIGLVLLGLVLVPTAGTQGGVAGVSAVTVVLVIYALAGFWGVPATERLHTGIFKSALPFGLLGGAVFAGEIILEYVLNPDANGNTLMGEIEFGTVFLLILIAGVRGAQQTGYIRYGVLAALWSALIASLIWYMVVLVVYYMFLGTPLQAQVFAAEGDFEDFARSGMTDRQAFIMQDFWGAGFFHLLLAPIFGMILGSVGGLVGKGLNRLGTRRVSR